MKNYLFILFFIGCFCSSYAQNDELNGSKWRLNIAGGLGYITTGISKKNTMIYGSNGEKVNDMYDDLKKGVQGHADIHYLFNKNVGLGMKYAFFTTNGSMTQKSHFYTLEFKETDYVNFIGPSLHLRSFIGDSRWAFSVTLSGGYAHFRGESEIYKSYFDNFPYPGERVLATGGTFGVSGGFGLEYRLNKYIALGFDMGYFRLSFGHLKVRTNYENDQKLEDFVNSGDNDYSRLDYSLGIKVYF